MKRRFLPCLMVTLALVSAARAVPLAPERREASVRYVNGLENPDGGFRATAAAGKSELRNMPAAVRATHYFGGELAHARRAAEFAQHLYDPATGSFHEPTSVPDVRSTALGLITLVELKEPPNEQYPATVRYFDQNAKTVPEMYIAEAALSAAGLQPLRPRAWLEAFQATRNADGSYGKTAADTARAVVTYLRLNARLPDRAGALKVLRASPDTDGAFGATGSTSDLETSYPVMRAFSMLKEKPDLARVRAFVDRCRNSDGGYGVRPGQPSAVTSTYYASIILHWIDGLENEGKK